MAALAHHFLPANSCAASRPPQSLVGRLHALRRSNSFALRTRWLCLPQSRNMPAVLSKCLKRSAPMPAPPHLCRDLLSDSGLALRSSLFDGASVTNCYYAASGIGVSWTMTRVVNCPNATLFDTQRTMADRKISFNINHQ